MPARKAWRYFLLTLFLDLASLGTLLVPVHLIAAFFATRLAFHTQPLSFHGEDPQLEAILAEPLPDNRPAARPRWVGVGNRPSSP